MKLEEGRDSNTSTPRYPIGIQTFAKIIEGGYSYVDKTAFIKPLLEHGQFIFLSRPRRFGKSLLVSTLKAYFEGRKELFKGLAIDSLEMDWNPSPVFHFDFTGENYSQEDGLERRLNLQLDRLEEIYGSDPRRESPGERFNYLIKRAYEKTGRQVVILVDEYDKPLLDIEEFPEIFERNQRILKSFYGNLKGMDEYIRYAFITGVARFSKVSIFSDLNNLDDISMSDEFSDICGWSEDELIKIFSPGIKALAQKRNEDYHSTLKALREYYDGYLFAQNGSRLYNPFSVLCALRAKDISPYWFETGTPTYLVRRVKKEGTYPPSLNGIRCTKAQLTSVGMNDNNPAPLMFQTGYLTIDSFDRGRFILRFPNYEVQTGFYQQLLPLYAPKTNMPDSPFSIFNFQDDLYDGNPEKFMERLDTLFRNIPYEDHNESTYRAITFLISVLCSTFAIAEHHSYKGRSDIEVLTWNFIYIFEFKYNKTIDEAFEQLIQRDYAGRYRLDSRPVFLIAANYIENKEERRLEYRIEELEKGDGVCIN